MTDTIAQRVENLAIFMIETGATVRRAAKHFGISKSTDLTQRLPQYNKRLYLQVRDILEVNKSERHIRGGMATKRKFEQNKIIR